MLDYTTIEFDLTVDYSFTIESRVNEMLSSEYSTVWGSLGWLVTDAPKPEDKQIKVKAALVHFDCEFSKFYRPESILREIGYRPATFRELLEFGKQYQGEWNFSVTALGAEYRSVGSGDIEYACLSSVQEDGKRRIYMHEAETPRWFLKYAWGKSMRFLAFRIEADDQAPAQD